MWLQNNMEAYFDFYWIILILILISTELAMIVMWMWYWCVYDHVCVIAETIDNADVIIINDMGQPSK